MTYLDIHDLYNIIHDGHNTSCPVEDIGSCAVSCHVYGEGSHPISCMVSSHSSCEDLIMTTQDGSTLVTFKHNDSTNKFDLVGIDFVGNSTIDNDWYLLFKLISQNSSVQYRFNNRDYWYTLNTNNTFELVDFYTSINSCSWQEEGLAFNPLLLSMFKLDFRVKENAPFMSITYRFTMSGSSMVSDVVVNNRAVLLSTKNITKNLDQFVPILTKMVNKYTSTAIKRGIHTPTSKLPSKLLAKLLTPTTDLTISLLDIVHIILLLNNM